MMRLFFFVSICWRIIKAGEIYYNCFFFSLAGYRMKFYWKKVLVFSRLMRTNGNNEVTNSPTSLKASSNSFKHYISWSQCVLMWQFPYVLHTTSFYNSVASKPHCNLFHNSPLLIPWWRVLLSLHNYMILNSSFFFFLCLPHTFCFVPPVQCTVTSIFPHLTSSWLLPFIDRQTLRVTCFLWPCPQMASRCTGKA